MKDEKMDRNTTIRKNMVEICANKFIEDGYADFNEAIMDACGADEIDSRLLSDTFAEMMSDCSCSFGKVCSNSDLKCKKFKCIKDILSRNGGANKDIISECGSLCCTDGVLFDCRKIYIRHIGNLSDIDGLICDLTSSERKRECEGNGREVLFYRGHSSLNYYLAPSLFRDPEHIRHEKEMFNDIQVACPEDFTGLHTHVQKLAMMQHYLLPTRLLDISESLLIALYFATKESRSRSKYGELVIFDVDDKMVKPALSDSVSILASLAALDFEDKNRLRVRASLCVHCGSRHASVRKFNCMRVKSLRRLIHEIGLEKPNFYPEIVPKDLLDSFFVRALRDNPRIVKQDGAFIICGLYGDETSSSVLKVNEALKKHRVSISDCNDSKKITCVVNKSEVRKILEVLGITEESLMPEIDVVARAITERYSGKQR